MSYLVLARKFRPQTFASIVGQEHITKALSNAILWNRVPHALLFTGPRGVGKTTSARVFARALNCTGREIPERTDPQVEADSVALVEPCGECNNCKEIARSASIAVWEIDGASNNSVENVRDLIDSLRSLPPPGSHYKIYIIDEVHMLSTAAFNALLKSLEEPPPNTVFIFATTEPHKIPETVISRCQRHDFRRLPTTVIAEALQQLCASENISADEDVFEFIAIKARGGMRDAQTMLDRLISFCGERLELAQAFQLFGVVDSSFFFRLSDAVFAQDTAKCFELLDEAFSQSLDVRAFVADFVTHFRNLFLLSTAKNADGRIARILEITKRDLQELAKQVEQSEAFDMQRIFELAAQTAETALVSNFPRYVLEAGVAKMSTLPSLRPLAEIIRSLENGGGAPAGSRGPTAASSGSGSVRAATRRDNAPRESAPPYSAPRDDASLESAPPSVAPQVAERNLPQDAQPSEVLSAAGFNPSWQDFIQYVKGARSEHVLAAYLCRVSPQTFVEGKLLVEGSAFDVDSLKHPQTNAALKSCLSGYSGRELWEVRLQVHEGVPPSSGARPLREPARQGAGAAAEKKRVANTPPGSIVAQEEEAERMRVERVDGEARNDPFVKAALSMFEGSAIEKVSVLKGQK